MKFLLHSGVYVNWSTIIPLDLPLNVFHASCTFYDCYPFISQFLPISICSLIYSPSYCLYSRVYVKRSNDVATRRGSQCVEIWETANNNAKNMSRQDVIWVRWPCFCFDNLSFILFLILSSFMIYSAKWNFSN